MRAAAPLLFVVVALAGCSLVNDPGRHIGAGFDAGPPGQDSGVPEDAAPDGGTDAGPLDAGTLAPIDACDALANINCDAYYDCCPSAPEPTPAQRDECVSRSRDFCQLFIEPALRDPVTDYDRHLAAQVLVEGQRFVAACSPDYFQLARRQDGIVRVMRGTIAEGEVCNPNNAPTTASLYACLGGPAARCLRTGALGPWRCGAPRAETVVCQHERDCADGLHCEGLFPSTCRQNLGAGATCVEDTDCESMVCGTDEPRLCLAPGDPDLFCTLAP